MPDPHDDGEGMFRCDAHRMIEKEKGEPGPASPELCKALGINPDDLSNALPPSRPILPKRTVHSALERQTPDTRNQFIAEATKAIANETLRTKEAVITVVATYIANKAENWWQQPLSYRMRELDFVIRMLINTYKELEAL